MKRKFTAWMTLFMVVVLSFGSIVHAEGEKKTVILGTSADYAPYEFHKTIDGVDTIVGFDIDIAKSPRILAQSSLLRTPPLMRSCRS